MLVRRQGEISGPPGDVREVALGKQPSLHAAMRPDRICAPARDPIPSSAEIGVLQLGEFAAAAVLRQRAKLDFDAVCRRGLYKVLANLAGIGFKQIWWPDHDAKPLAFAGGEPRSLRPHPH